MHHFSELDLKKLPSDPITTNEENTVATGRGSHNLLDLNTTQTNALLAMRLDDDKFNLMIQ